jgi:hypothetical protein
MPDAVPIAPDGAASTGDSVCLDRRQSANREAIEGGDFTAEFAHSTLENWQSEFLPLFSFVTSALLIHKPSAESKASDDRMEEALRHIEQKLGTN